MKIKWLGHSSFLITSESGVKIVTDPYSNLPQLRYGSIKETADLVTVSHGHGDHNNAAAVGGNPRVVNQAVAGEIKGVKFQGIPAFHDEAGGKQRGNDIIFCFEVDGMRVCHMGDLGQQLTDQQKAGLGKVDILFIPVGGNYTIDARGASQVASQLAPRVIIPMHFKTNKCDYPIAPVDDFLKGKKDVQRLSASEVEFKSGTLPAGTQIIVFQPAL